MTLPADFSQQEHLQSTIRSWINREVRDYFSDVGADDWDPDILTPRASLRVACHHEDTDSLLMTSLRWQLFERIRRSKFDVPWLGLPAAEYNQERKYKPQIYLFFQEDLGDTEFGYHPVTGRVSFRAMGYDNNTFTPTVAQTFASRINTEFANGGGFIWRKGRLMMTYNDWGNGYALQVLARDEGYGRQLIAKVLDLQNDNIDEAILKVNQTQNEAAAYPIIPPNDYIYGESRRMPRKRPLADVRFQYAVAHVHGLANPIPLVDRTGLYPSALMGA